MERIREEVLYKYPFYQPVEGYRYSIDALLLAGFVKPVKDKALKCLDIGTGSGIITLLLSKRFPDWSYSGVEIQEELYEIACENFKLHELSVDLVHGDYKGLPGQDSYDLIVSNPPFFKGGHISKNRQEAIARHELEASMETLIKKSNKLLKGGGFLYVIYPAERMAELLVELSLNKLMPYALKMVYPSPGKEAEMVLVTAKKGHKGKLKVLPPFYIYSQKEVDSKETAVLYQEGVIKW